jgi:predicted nucleic acid-binding protein
MIGLADTSLFIARETRRRIQTQLPDELAVSVITVGELRLGVLMAADVETRHRRLTTLQIASAIEPLPVDDRVAETWSGLVARLRAEGRRMPLNDSWIAATALTHGMPVVTQDSDYDDIPGLEIVKI